MKKMIDLILVHDADYESNSFHQALSWLRLQVKLIDLLQYL
jgi:hypothetical protein